MKKICCPPSCETFCYFTKEAMVVHLLVMLCTYCIPRISYCYIATWSLNQFYSNDTLHVLLGAKFRHGSSFDIITANLRFPKNMGFATISSHYLFLINFQLVLGTLQDFRKIQFRYDVGSFVFSVSIFYKKNRILQLIVMVRK